MRDEFVIGVLGGMGTYATIHVFEQYATVFPAEKEWDRPRIIIDNRCTMPSRVRAFLYGENAEKLVEEMTDSMSCLINSGCSHIILACNTSHLFLKKIYEKIPDLKARVVDIIETCVEDIDDKGISEIYLLGSEGTIEAKVYQQALAQRGISCIVPKPEEYVMLRICIEAVKQNKYSENVKRTFLELVNRYDNCILGCTELPVLAEMYKDEISISQAFDPVFLSLVKLKREYDDE